MDNEQKTQDELLENEIIIDPQDVEDNAYLMKKSKGKGIVFLSVTILLLIFFFLFRKNPLFIFSFSDSGNEISGTTVIFNILSYLFIIATFIYMFFYLSYYRKRLKYTLNEQIKDLNHFKTHYNIFDLLGVIPVFLAILTLINGMFFGFATVVGPSMQPTFCGGDYVVINHFHETFVRDDIIIFTYDDSKLIKRVVGLPDDHLVVNENGVFINDIQVETYFPSTFIATDIIIPDGYYYVLGDNRHNSNDSRSFGLVDFDQVLGKVVFKIGGSSCS